MGNNQWLSILEGDKDAFLSFYEENFQRLYSYGYRLSGNKELTKDCIQELFLELWKSRHSVNIEVKSALSYLMTWLRRIICRQIKSISKQHTSSINQDDTENELSYEELLVKHQTDEEIKKNLQAALLHLSPSQLKIIRLRFFEHKTIQEIADENSLAKQTVYNVIYKALVILKQVMGEFGVIFIPFVLPATMLISSNRFG